MQRFKREMFRMAMEKADAKLVLAARDGQSGQGTRRRGTSPMTFKTRFGTVEVQRQRVEDDHRAAVLIGTSSPTS